ncbi:uncharacterized protein BO80DRAFT_266444 [Aspergillus ibericus CBS 121593]|uniref:Uncharacterized protein n=1 Tax=Aspergillus ibericus CBS 121593 TaxID=1448316 RepID=A0A395GMT3_9EURO|nr:hypothetical protein BO80DRAFT_266444 [Aspergillus ibericus CBS 121593]RAK95323.1 hypothetical protein BO80DRAFT_266444 [Aspergillus ibericus CBS 121593]
MTALTNTLAGCEGPPGLPAGPVIRTGRWVVERRVTIGAGPNPVPIRPHRINLLVSSVPGAPSPAPSERRAWQRQRYGPNPHLAGGLGRDQLVSNLQLSSRIPPRPSTPLPAWICPSPHSVRIEVASGFVSGLLREKKADALTPSPYPPPGHVCGRISAVPTGLFFSP